jgi:hypothetical protein
VSNAWRQQINWMACALIKARDRDADYAALLTLLYDWPERWVCALAAKLAPAPGQTRDRASAIAALEGFASRIPPEIAARMRATAVELAVTSDVFRMR